MLTRQRFSHTKDKSTKVLTPVKFPLNLDMMPYTTPYVNYESFFKNKTNGKANGVTNGALDPSSVPSTPSKNKAEANGSPATPVKPEPSITRDYSSLLDYPKEHWPPDLLAYGLSAVIVHKGEIDTGHYINYAREGTDWFLFDDSKVVLVNEAEVLAAEAYLLLYVLKDLAPWAGPATPWTTTNGS